MVRVFLNLLTFQSPIYINSARRQNCVYKRRLIGYKVASQYSYLITFKDAYPRGSAFEM